MQKLHDEKLKIGLPYDAAIPLLDIEKNWEQKNRRQGLRVVFAHPCSQEHYLQ